MDSLVATGEQAYMRGEFGSASAIWHEALDRSRLRHDSTVEARTLTWLGLGAWRLGNYGDARRLGEQALDLKLRWALKAELSKSYNALGLLAWNEGRLAEATARFGKALDAARLVDDPKGIAAASGNLALVQTELGEFEAARLGFDAMRQAARELGDARIEGNAHTNLGMLFIRLGQPHSAVPELESARRLYRSIAYSTGEQNALAQLGTAYTALGQPHQALAALDSALALSRSQATKQEEAGNLEAIAGVYRDAGDLSRALALLTKARAINRDLKLAVEEGTDARSQAEIQAGLGSLASALTLADAALASHREAGARYEELSDLLLLADLADRAGNTALSDRWFREARTLAARLRVRVGRAQVTLAEARIADRRHLPSRVLEVLRRGRQDIPAGGYGMEHESFLLETRALARSGRLEAAVVTGRLAIAAVERMRGRYASSHFRTTYLADNQAAYGELAGVLLQLGRTDEAFEVADAARARALLEYTTGAYLPPGPRADASAAGAPGEQLLSSAAALANELRQATQGLGDDGDADAAARVARIDRKLQMVRGEYEDLLLRRGEAEMPGGVPLSPRGSRLRDVQASLGPREALLEYQPAGDSLIVFVVRRDGIAAVTIPLPASRLLSRVRFARGLLAQPREVARAGAVLTSLHEELVGTARRTGLLAGAYDLLVIPHGVLTYLPFGALQDPTTGRYLAQDYTLRVLPSAATQVGLSAAKVAGAGKPRLPASILAPLPAALPGSVPEAYAVRRSLPGAVLLIGRDADERAIRKALASGGIVHLATHALMNPGNPMFSSIELYGGSTAGDGDGKLEVHEILAAPLASPLVFLSGCETGLGASWATDFTPGEDYATLARAFLYAGARNVVATLWQVEDDGAAQLAARFYRHLESKPAALALASAQRDLMGDPRFRAPYYWAGYVLSGDGDVHGATGNGGPVSVR